MTTNHRDGSSVSSLWGLILAAGDGRRLQNYVRQVRGEDLPKQYVNFIGRRSMLEHTYDRVEKVIPANQIVTVVSKQHLRYGPVRCQLSRRAPQDIIVQPQNKETGPGILLPLMYINKRCPDAIVAVSPSDHFILEENRFMDHVALAARAVAHDGSRFVILAMEAQHPEVEYGYILPRANEGWVDLWGIRNTALFIEKPDRMTAHTLIGAGALWNTMIMVFKLRNLLEAMQKLCPRMYSDFSRIQDAIGTANETKVVEDIYQNLKPENFSTAFLEKIAAIRPNMLSVLPVLRVSWSDWGSPERLLRAQDLLGERAQRAKPQRPKPAASRAPQKNNRHDVLLRVQS